MEEKYREALNAALKLCESGDARLLYLVVFGAELYGTETGSSDLDVRGVFLPSARSIILREDKRSLRFSTGAKDSRNTSEDVDIDLWSVDYWTRSLLPGGDTGALDLLFSPSHEKRVLFRSPMLDPVFDNPLKFLDLANNRAYAQYSLSQAKKYGIKGSRLGAIKAVWKWLEARSPKGKLGESIDALVAEAGHDKYCFAKDTDAGKVLALCGKIHVGGIKMDEFRERVRRDMERYGSRAKDAEENHGVDYKALSHAVRALDEMNELLLTGRVRFPLATRENLIKIKKGEIPWIELESIILARLAETDRLYDLLSSGFSYDPVFAERFILDCYGLGRSPSEGEIAEAIREELRKLEREERIVILYAVEAGSRAWGFPSLDSDYDIRFIYARDPVQYLSTTPEREKSTIERMTTLPSVGEIDLSGWDLRKALKIFQAGNPQIAEWLFSPIVYLEKGDLAALLRNMASDAISRGSFWRHYRGLLENAFKKIGSGNQSDKAILYVVRPLLILLWLERDLPIPPATLEEIAARTLSDDAILARIRELIEKKRFALEKDGRPSDGELIEWLTRQYKRLAEKPLKMDYSRRKVDVDALFRKILRDTFPNG